MSKRYAAWLWLLSGFPVGAALIFMPHAAQYYCFIAFIVLQTAHSLSPIVLAWSHGEYRRQIIYAQPRKFILWPLIVFLAALVIGGITQVGWTAYNPQISLSAAHPALANPFVALVWFYSGWNLYHFAMQDYGVLRLIGWGKPRFTKPICLIVLLSVYFGVSGMNIFGFWYIPGLRQSVWWGLGPLVLMGAITVNHWIVDVGLSTKVAGWWFLPVILVLGGVGFVWLIPTADGEMVRMIPVLVCARLGLGIVHFLYSRWVWQFSNPMVRATIGMSLARA